MFETMKSRKLSEPTSHRARRHTLAGKVMLVLTCVCTFAGASDVWATCSPANCNSSSKWAGNSFSYEIDAYSLDQAWLTLPSNFLIGAEYWMGVTGIATSRWRTRTGADITFAQSYNDGTDYGAYGCGDHNDGHNSIGARSGSSGSGLLVDAWVCCNASTHVIEEADICVWGASGSKTFNFSEDLASTEYDYIGAVEHGIGLGLGLGGQTDTDLSVLSTSGSAGKLTRRIQVGRDISAIRTRYGTRSGDPIYIQTNSSGSWGSEIQIPNGYTTFHQPAAALGKYTDSYGTSGGKFVVAITGTDDQVRLLLGDYPLSSSTGSWTSVTDTSWTSWRSPAVAASSAGTVKWVAAWTNKETTIPTSAASCAGITVRRSGDAFATSSSTTLSGANYCTLQQPAIAYDNETRAFVMAFVKQSLTNGEDGMVYLTESDDGGASWSTPVSSGYLSFDTPGLACGFSNGAAALGSCLLALGQGETSYDGSSP